MASTPANGSDAPDFTLPGIVLVDGVPQHRAFTLSAEHGHPVVLAFYPGDDTPVCTRQLCSYTANAADFAGLDAIVWGISSQDVDSHARFAQKRDITVPLLADPAKQVIKAYGVSGPLGTKRSVFVIDAAGQVAWQHSSAIGLTYKDTPTIAAVLRTLDAA